MSNALRQPVTVEQFLAWEERQELRHEFDGVQPVAMTGGSYAHDTISVNLTTALTTSRTRSTRHCPRCGDT